MNKTVHVNAKDEINDPIALSVHVTVWIDSFIDNCFFNTQSIIVWNHQNKLVIFMTLHCVEPSTSISSLHDPFTVTSNDQYSYYSHSKLGCTVSDFIMKFTVHESMLKLINLKLNFKTVNYQ